MRYGPTLWGRIWKTQLALASAEQFWECLTTGTPVNREAEKLVGAGLARIPVGLVISLTKVAGMDEREVLSLSPTEALARWQEFLLSLGQRPTGQS